MSFWSKLDRSTTWVAIIVCGVSLVIMMSAVVANVIGRIFFALPIYGTVEIVSLGGVFLISFAIGYTERKQSHIVIRILFNRFPQRLQSLFTIVFLFLSLGIIALLAWGGFWIGLEDATTPGATTYVLHLNKAPFRFAWVLGCIVLFGFLFRHLLEGLNRMRKK
jgi:TRAP-type C4-dicarboxylate transport system permease small subunit